MFCFHLFLEENIQDDYTHISNEERPNEEDSGMESSGHSLVEAELLEEKTRASVLDENMPETLEMSGNVEENCSESVLKEEASSEEELVDFKQLYFKEKKLLEEAKYQLEESKLRISNLEKHLSEELAAKDKLNEKCNDLQKDLSEQALHISEARFKLEEEKAKTRKVQKCFEREWEEFEKRLIEERAAKSDIEQQFNDSLKQLEKERSLKVALQKELETLKKRSSQFEQQTQQQEVSTTLSEMQICDARPELSSCDWRIQRSEVEVLEEKSLGTGGWGVVKEGRFRGSKVAVKQIHELILSPHNRRLFMREMNIASRCRHPCLLQFVGATNDDGIPLFVTELMDISVRDLLEKQPLVKTDIVAIALDVTRALNYLHLNSPPIIHRDISSANVLLWRRDNQWRAKVSDYGTANFMRQCRTINPGAAIYSAPEALSSEQSPKVCTPPPSLFQDFNLPTLWKFQVGFILSSKNVCFQTPSN